MITWSQSYKRAADDCGVSVTLNNQALTNIKQDINQGVRNFKNAARRYWTRKEVVTNLVAGQQYYTFPADMVRITTVRATNGSLIIPMTQIDSEERWNRMNVLPTPLIGVPLQYFVRGRNEVGLFPIPAQNVTNGLLISYEPRLRDMSIDDTTPTVNVVQNSATVTASTGTPFSVNDIGKWFSVTDGSDGNWYQVVGYTDSTHITLENVYQGPSSNGVAAILGQAADIPEDYQLAPVYFACFNYYMRRKDKDTAGTYNALYNNLLNDFQKVYAAKTTGMVQDDVTLESFNLFGIPPTNVTS